jgi:hypothetical protein
MVRQDDRGVDLKPTLRFRTLNGIAQGIDLSSRSREVRSGRAAGK